MATILAIDDDPELFQLLQKLVEKEGHHVEMASDGQSGLEKAREIVPSLILLDIKMPGFDGFEVLTRIQRDDDLASIPVVMLTGRGETQAIFRAQELGARDYLIKPFTSQAFLDLIRSYVS